MNWSSIAQYSELIAGSLLIVRLLTLNLHRVYRYFCFFLMADISGTLIWAIQRSLQQTQFRFDYRLVWLVGRLLTWPFILLTVYALLGAILANLPGILRLSRRVLNWSFLVALAIGLFTAIPEYKAASSIKVLPDHWAHVVQVALVLDRVVTSVALLALLCILIFLIWFPVEMSRNISVFFGGFAVYFALRGFLLLVPSYWSPQLRHTMNIAQALLSAAIFAFWGFLISRTGESIASRLSINWAPREQELLIGQLEAMNASLLRTARR